MLKRYIIDLIIRKRPSELPPPANFLGALPSVEKYRNSLLGEGFFFLMKKLLDAPGTRGHDGSMETPRVCKREKIKPERAFLLMINHWGALTEYGDYWERATSRVGGKYPIGIVTPLTDKVELEKFCKEHRLSWGGHWKSGKFLMEIARFVSHFKVWQHCAQREKLVLIMEWGASVLGAMPGLQVEHITVLSQQGDDSFTSPPQQVKDRPYRSVLIPVPFCYAITPAGAGKLIEGATGAIIKQSFNGFMCRILREMKAAEYPILRQEFDLYPDMRKHVLRTIR